MQLEKVTFGAHREILAGLGVEATQTANTAISDARARNVVSTIGRQLLDQGQIDELRPKAVLDALVDHSVVVRQGEHAIAFQHQQFQEWHSSFSVESTMLQSSDGDYDANRMLITDILNMPAWEEAILFACERLSRQNETGQKAVSDAVIETLSIDPMLAADMIFRSTDAVWDHARDDMLAFVDRWHRPGAVDRAARFMIMTGRPEFSEKIWLLLSNNDAQIHLNVLRSAPHFRPSVLGSNAEDLLLRLPKETRTNVLGEIASNSSIDGMELAACVAQKDTSLEVQIAVIESLFFRDGDRLAKEILRGGSDQLWKAFARNNRSRDFDDPEIATRVKTERLALSKEPMDKVRSFALLADIDGDEDFPPGRDEEVQKAIYDLLSDQDFPVADRDVTLSINRAFEKYPELVRKALLHRLESNWQLPSQSTDILADAPIVDEGPIADLVLNEPAGSKNAACAAGMVGPKTITKLLDILFTHNAKEVQGERLSNVDADQYRAVSDRLKTARIEPLVEVWSARANTDMPEEISLLARTLSGFGNWEQRDTILPLDDEARLTVAEVLRHWTSILIADKKSRRDDLAKLATIIGKLGQTDLLDCLVALLDEDIVRRYAQLKELRRSNGRVDRNNEARVVYDDYYRRAFALLGGHEVSKALEAYLLQPEFGPEAANAIKEIYEKSHKPEEEDRTSFGGPDFSVVEKRRKEITSGVSRADTDAAAAIFNAVEQLNRTGKERNLALHLARVATLLPHRRRPELIAQLLALPVTWAAKREYCIALVLSGEMLNADMLVDCIKEFLETAKTEKLRLDNDAWELHSWLELLPYSDRPGSVLEVLELVPPVHMAPWRLRRLLNGLGNTLDPDSERVLFELAEGDPRFYGNDDWVSATLNLETETAYTKLFELTEADPSVMGRFDGFHYDQQLQGFLNKNPGFRAEVLDRYKVGEFNRLNGIVEQVLAKSANAETVIAFVKAHAAQGDNHVGGLHTAIKSAVLEYRPIPGWNGAFEVYGKAAPSLRKDLFAMMSGPEAELASGCLTFIDRLRDKHGRMEFEPRHPDIESKLPWPTEAKTAVA